MSNSYSDDTEHSLVSMRCSLTKTNSLPYLHDVNSILETEGLSLRIERTEKTIKPETIGLPVFHTNIVIGLLLACHFRVIVFDRYKTNYC